MGNAHSQRRNESGLAPPHKLPPPPAFENLGVLGAGAYGEVTCRRLVSTGEVIAVKAVPFNLLHPERRAKVHREARVLETLRHPHVVSFRGVWVHSGALGIRGQVLIGMELCAGSLGSLFEHAPRRAYARRHEAMAQCADALAHCHRRGVMHRDLKLENVLYTSTAGHTCEGCATLTFKVADFGVAALMEQTGTPLGGEADASGGRDGTSPAAAAAAAPTGRAAGRAPTAPRPCARAPSGNASSLQSLPYATMAGGRRTMVVGTPLYMAGEVFWSDEYGRACDIYSLGCVYRELLTGTRMHASANVVYDQRAHESGLKPVHARPVRRCWALLQLYALLTLAACAAPVGLECLAPTRSAARADAGGGGAAGQGGPDAAPPPARPRARLSLGALGSRMRASVQEGTGPGAGAGVDAHERRQHRASVHHASAAPPAPLGHGGGGTAAAALGGSARPPPPPPPARVAEPAPAGSGGGGSPWLRPVAPLAPVVGSVVLVLALVGLTVLALAPALAGARGGTAGGAAGDAEGRGGRRSAWGRRSSARSAGRQSAVPGGGGLAWTHARDTSACAQARRGAGGTARALLGLSLRLLALLLALGAWLCEPTAWATLPLSVLLCAPALAGSAHEREVRLLNAMMADAPSERPTVSELRAELRRIRALRALHAGCLLGAGAGVGALVLLLRPQRAEWQPVACAWALSAAAALAVGELIRLELRRKEALPAAPGYVDG